MKGETKMVEITQVKNVIVEGAELLHDRMIQILGYILDKEPIRKLEKIIIYKEKGPRGCLAKYFPELEVIAINLPMILERSIERAKADKDDFRMLTGVIWINQIWAFAHDIHHAVYFATGDDEDALYDEEKLKTEEKEASEYGEEVIKEIAMNRPDLIEAPALGEIPFFNLHIMQMIINAIKEGEEWAITQKELIEENVMYRASNFDLQTMREYIRVCKANNADWEPATQELVMEEPKAAAVGAGMEGPEKIAGKEALEEATMASAPAGQLALPIQPDGGEILDMPEEMPYEGGDDFDIGGGVYVGQPEVTPTQDDGGAPAVQTQTAPAGQVHPSFTQIDPTQGTLPATDPVYATILKIYHAIYGYIFDKVWDPRGIWKDANALWLPLHIWVTVPGSKEIITASVTNKSGRNENVPIAHGVVGRTFKNHTMPGYDLIMQVNGQRLARRLIVQNPWKGTQYAQSAQGGSKIMWVINIDMNNDWKGSIRDGVWVPQGTR
jgi:hypothetical protein